MNKSEWSADRRYKVCPRCGKNMDDARTLAGLKPYRGGGAPNMDAHTKTLSVMCDDGYQPMNLHIPYPRKR